LYRRTSAVTVAVLKEYKEMIANTTSDLEEHLQKIDNKLQSFSLQGARISDEGTAERQQMQEERDSIQQCLGICAKVLTHIDHLQPIVLGNISTPSATYQGPVTTLSDLTPARTVTVDAFKACKDRLTYTTTQLEKNLQIINNRLQHFSSQSPEAPNEQAAEKERIEEELDSIKQCLAICAEASRQADKDRTNVFEDISMADDGYQVFVSTIGDLISARRITAGARSIQLLGQMSDDSLQQLSRDLGHTAIEKATELQTGKGTQFEDRYGAGVSLSLQNLKDVGTTHK
jgi:Fungal N-terminal domain of STAND proteins